MAEIRQLACTVALIAVLAPTARPQTEPVPAARDPAVSEPAVQESATQDPAVQDSALAEMVEKIRAAHRGDRTATLDRFRAALRFKSVAADQDSIEFDITATFLAPRYLRYRVEEPGEILQRGWDDRGAWAQVGDVVDSVGGREGEQERERVRQQVGLARQLLGFLDPSALIAGLDGAVVAGREDLPVGRKEVRSCDVIRGIASQFPMFMPPAGAASEPRCGLKLFADAETHRLVAVVATPIDAEDRPIGAPEFVLLRDYTDQQQVAVPRSLLVYSGAPGTGRLSASVAVRAIDIDPDGVTRETMQRGAR